MALQPGSDDVLMNWLDSQYAQPAPNPFAPPDPQQFGAVPAATEITGPGTTAPKLAPPDDGLVDPSLIEIDPAPQAQMGFPRAPAPGSALGPDLEMPPEFVGQPSGPADPYAFESSMANPEAWNPPDPLASVDDAYPTSAAVPMDASLIPDEYQTVTELGNTYAADPEKRAIARDELEEARRRDASTKIAIEAKARDEAAHRDHVAFKESRLESEKAMRQLAADSERLAATPIDPDRRSTLTRIAHGIAAFFGGMGGGQNQVLSMIGQELDRDVDAQKASIAARQAALGRRAANIGEQMQLNREIEHEAAAYRDSTFARIEAQIITEAQDFDPHGTQALKRAETLAGVRGERAKALLAQQDADQKAAFEIRKQGEIERHNKATEDAAARKAAGSGSGGGAASSEKVAYSPQQLQSLNPTVPSNLIPPVPMTLKEFGAHLDRARKGGEAGKAVREGSTDERARTLGVANLKDERGEPWLAQNETVATDLSNKVNVTRAVVDIIDEAMSIRDRSGGASKWVNSPDYQRLIVLQNQLIKHAKSGTTGMSSDADMEKLANSFGGADLTSFRAMDDGLKAGRDQAIGALHRELRAKQFPGELPKFGSSYAPPKKTKDEQAYQGLKESTTGELKRTIPAYIPGLSMLENAYDKIAGNTEDSVLPDGKEKEQIDKFAADVTGSDPEVRKRAVSFLYGMQGSSSPAVRLYALNALHAALPKAEK